jgi:hypothetical protein
MKTKPDALTRALRLIVKMQDDGYEPTPEEWALVKQVRADLEADIAARAERRAS